MALKKYAFFSLLTTVAILAGPALAQAKAETPAENASKTAETPKAGGSGEARKKAMDIGSQPARDLGVAKIEIPAPLQRARDAPYGLKDLESCKAIEAEIAALNEALGPDFDAGDKPKSSPAKWPKKAARCWWTASFLSAVWCGRSRARRPRTVAWRTPSRRAWPAAAFCAACLSPRDAKRPDKRALRRWL
jgi:hypothetical protein